MFGQSVGLGRLDQILIPNQHAERAAEEIGPRAQLAAHHHQATGHPVEDDDLLSPQVHEGALGHFDKENERHPLGTPGHAHPGHQPEVNRARQHHEADEERRPQGLCIEARFKGGVGGHNREALLSIGL